MFEHADIIFYVAIIVALIRVISIYVSSPARKLGIDHEMLGLTPGSGLDIHDSDPEQALREYDLELSINPEPIIIKNEIGELLSVFNVEQNRINVKRQVTFYTSRIENDKYEMFYELIAGWRDNFHNKLYIQEK